MERAALPKQNSLKKYAWILIIILAIFLRLAYVGYNNVGHYIIPSMITALDIAEGKSFPLQGPALGEFNAKHGPASYYLFALPILFNHNPLNIFLFISLLNVISIYVIYRTGKDFFSENVGLIAALIHAVQPNLVIFSRNVTDDALVQIFVALVYYCFFSIISNKKARLPWVILPGAFALGMQLHFQLGLTLFFVVLQFIYYRPHVPEKHLKLGIGIGLLCLFPQIWHDLTISNTHFLSFYYAGIDFLKGNVNVPDHQANRRDNVFANCIIVFGVLFYYYLAAIVLAVARMAHEKIKTGTWLNFENKKIISLIVFSTTSLLVFSRYGSQIFNRHHAAFTPMTILIGIALSNVISASFKDKGPYVRILAVFVKSVVALFFAGIMLLYVIKSFGFALISIDSTPSKFFDVFGRYMCVDHYRDDCGDGSKHVSLDFYQDTYIYRKKQFEVFFNDFGTDRKTLLRNVHGMPYFRMFGDDGYLFRTLPQGKAVDAASFHYLIAEKDSLDFFIDRAILMRSVYLSPFIVLKYKSHIDYSGLKYLYTTDEQATIPEPGNQQWNRFERGVDRAINLGITSDSLDTTNHYHWVRTWEEHPIMISGSIEKPDKFSSLMLVVEVLFQDDRETLVGRDRVVDVHLWFNNLEIETTEVGYKGNSFFGESYKYYYNIDKKLFTDSSVFTFTMNAPHSGPRYAIDVYDVALSD